MQVLVPMGLSWVYPNLKQIREIEGEMLGAAASRLRQAFQLFIFNGIIAQHEQVAQLIRV